MHRGGQRSVANCHITAAALTHWSLSCATRNIIWKIMLAVRIPLDEKTVNYASAYALSVICLILLISDNIKTDTLQRQGT